jgi:hypothetical protein
MASSSIVLTDRQIPLSPHPAARIRNRANDVVLLLPAILLLYSTLLPQEVRLNFAGQVIYPYRGVAFLLLPWLLNRIATGRYPFRLADLWMFAGVTWMVVSFCVFYGVADGVRRGGALAFDTIAPYLIARTCVRDFQDVRRLLIVAAPGLMLAGLSMLVESVSHRQLVRPFAAAIFGPLAYYENGQAVSTAREFVVVRLGFLRAHGPFSHPILAGLFMASFLPLYLKSSIRKWPYALGLTASLFAVFSVSSAAFLSIIISIVLLGYDRFQSYLSGIGWRFFVFAVFTFLLAVEMASQNGVMPILIRYTLDPQTGYYRQLIWEYGMRSIELHPWFGIGFTDYERLPWMITSIDNHWLLLGVRHGHIAPICVFMSCLVSILGLAKSCAGFGKRESVLAKAIIFSLTGLLISAFTTSFFGGLHTWFYMIVGMTLSLAATSGSTKTMTG